MAGPWEKFAQAPANQGPWTRFAPKDQYSGSYFAQGTSGLNEGLANILGAPVDLANAAIGLGMKGINALAGTNFQPSQEPLGGSAGLKRSMQEAGAIRPPTDETGKQMARRTMQSVGSAAIPALGAGASVPTALSILGSGAGGGGSAAIAQQMFPDNPYAEMGAELLGSFGTAGGIAAAQRASANKAARVNVPTVEKLKEQASRQYDLAEQNGVAASRVQTHKLSTKMRQIAADEGLISPTGRVSEAYPKAREALRLFEDYSAGQMTVPQMKTVRKVLADAAKSTDDAERRMAKIMLDEFDNFTSPLAPQLARARQLYHAAMKGEQMETMKELAGSRAGQFTGSGFENALRTEYRTLDRNIIKGNQRGFSDAEQRAVSKVAQGTPASNTFRNIGRFAPTGPVSAMASAGVPATIGTMLGGPVGGAVGATLGSGITGASRAVATRMGTNAARDAELLARNFGIAPVGAPDPEFIRRLLAGTAATNLASQASRDNSRRR